MSVVADSSPDASGGTDATVDQDATIDAARDTSGDSLLVMGDGGASDGSAMAEAAPSDAGNPISCSAYMGNCHAATGAPCCQGLICLNQAVCCVSPGQIGGGNCTFDMDCCSGHCQDSGTFFGNCLNVAGQSCLYSTDCSSGLQCGTKSVCCASTGAPCGAAAECCNGSCANSKCN